MMMTGPSANRFSMAAAGMAACLVMAACSGGDNSGGTASVASPITGTFVDSPVNGLHYTSPPSNPAGGVTANGGQYQCVPGDTVTFDLGGRMIGNPQPCGELVTVLSVFGATSITDVRVKNLAQLLLTLGGILAGSQPIELPATLPASLPTSLDFADPQFEQMLQTGLPDKTLVTQEQVAAHLRTSFTTLTVTANGGQITSIPAGLVCTTGTCSYDFVRGTAVTLAATGTGFTGWSGGGCTGTGTCQILLTAMQVVQAVFLAIPPPATLTIDPNPGTGTGQVRCSTGGTFGPCATTYPNGTALTLRGVANIGSTFTGWSNGTGNISCTGTADCSFTVTADSSVTATFTLAVTNFSVKATVATTNGGGGTVQCSANGGAAGPCGSYPVDTTIVMTATPNSVSNFTGWTGAGCSGTGTCTFTLTANTAVTAHFNRPVLTVTVVGTGTVTSSPVGINCGATCVASFNRGTSITLTAIGDGFTGWSGGGCSGTGTCIATLNVSTSVTATFGTASAATRYKFVWADGGALMAIDPVAPAAAPATVAASGVAGSSLVYSGSFDAGTTAFTNVQTPIETFAQGGRLWRVNTARAAGVPGSTANPAVQVSNETGATNLCRPGLSIVQTGSTSTARIVYEFAGADGNCDTRGDNITKLVPVLADASTPPLILPTGTTPTGDGEVIFNLANGQPLAIFLVDLANSNTLRRMDLATNSVTDIQAGVGNVEFLAQDTSSRVFIRGSNTLYVYNSSSNVLTSLLTTGSPLGCDGDTCSDETNLFVFEQAGRVFRVPLTATSSSDVVTLINSTTTPVRNMLATNTRLILETEDFPGGPQSLFSMPKTGGTQTTLAAPGVDHIVFITDVANDLVYYQLLDFSGPSLSWTAVVAQDDGTAVATFANSRWNGRVNENTTNMRSRNNRYSKVVRTTFGSSVVDPFVGANVTIHDAAAPLALPVSLGAVPSTTPSLSSVNFRAYTDNYLLGIGFNDVTSNRTILLGDSTIPNSLVIVPLSPAPWNGT